MLPKIDKKKIADLEKELADLKAKEKNYDIIDAGKNNYHGVDLVLGYKFNTGSGEGKTSFFDIDQDLQEEITLLLKNYREGFANEEF
mgnify:CR=1 FL=1